MVENVRNSNQMELGQLLLNEKPQTNNFSLALSEFLFSHRFHESQSLALRVWMAVFLSSFSAIDHPNYPIVRSTVLDVQKSYQTFIIVYSDKSDEQKSSLLGCVFSFEKSNPLNNTNFRIKLKKMAEQYQIEPESVSIFKYSLTMKHDRRRQENVYRVSRGKPKLSKKLSPAQEPDTTPSIPTSTTVSPTTTEKPELTQNVSLADLLTRSGNQATILVVTGSSNFSDIHSLLAHLRGMPNDNTSVIRTSSSVFQSMITDAEVTHNRSIADILNHRASFFERPSFNNHFQELQSRIDEMREIENKFDNMPISLGSILDSDESTDFGLDDDDDDDDDDFDSFIASLRSKRAKEQLLKIIFLPNCKKWTA